MTHGLPLQVAFLTGQSDPHSCALSPEQHRFLNNLGLVIGESHPLNFPYREGMRVHHPTPLARAAWQNLRLFLHSRQPHFSNSYRPMMIDLLSQAGHTCLLAGSCGVELLNNMALPPEWLSKVSVFAYGPVARSHPACRCVTVQGRSDRFSRWYFPQVDHRVDGGHMDYLRQPEVLQLCQDFLTETRRRIGS